MWDLIQLEIRIFSNLAYVKIFVQHFVPKIVQIKIVFINLDFFYHPSKITSAYLFFKYGFKKNVIVNVDTTDMLF